MVAAGLGGLLWWESLRVERAYAAYSDVDAGTSATAYGACSGCPSSTATLRNGVQNLLKHFIPEVREVRAVQACVLVFDGSRHASCVIRGARRGASRALQAQSRPLGASHAPAS